MLPQLFYNRVGDRFLLRRCLQLALFCALACSPLLAADARATSTVLVFPFHNISSVSGIEWLAESFPEVLSKRLASPRLYFITRDDRLYALDRLGIPAGATLSRATMYNVGREMGADYLIFGEYNFNGQSFTATAQVFDVDRLRLSPIQTESGALTDVWEIEESLAWDLLPSTGGPTGLTKAQFVSAAQRFRLDAFENYLRGITAPDPEGTIEHLRKAVELAPDYSQAKFELAKAYYNQRDYQSADLWFRRVANDPQMGIEASYYLGLGAYYLGDFPAAQSAFELVASRLPLTEVYNNLGVVVSRRGATSAVEYFRRAAQDDPQDADYHFNLGVALCRAGDRSGCSAQLKQALALDSEDQEARDFLARVEARGPLGEMPLERVKVNYDEHSFRQLSQEIDNQEEQRLAAADPRTHANYHLQRGRDLFTQGFISESARELREAIRLDPANSGAHLMLARALEGMDNDSQARQELQAALSLQPSAEAYVELGEMDLRGNHFAQAQAEASQALALEPGNSAALALLKNSESRLSGTSAPAKEPQR